MWLAIRILIIFLMTLTALLRIVNSSPTDAPAGERQPAVADRVSPFIVDLAQLNVLDTRFAPVIVSPPPVDPTALQRWQEPASAWMDTALRLIVVDHTAPTHAARELMLLGVALHDGLVAAEAAQTAGEPISVDALFAAIAPRILAYSHPLQNEVIQSAAGQAAWVGVWRGDVESATILPSSALGAAVADAVLAWAATDGADRPVGEPPPLQRAPGRWAPTPPHYETAQFPEWATVRTVVIGDPAFLRTAAPPAWQTPVMDRERADFVAVQEQLSPTERELAAAWAAGAGTVTPPGMWMERAINLVRRDARTTSDATRIYAVLGVTLHDVGVACWESKYHYQVARPIQWLSVHNPAWLPYLDTPPHPSYPSGHASFSGAGSAVLTAYFPGDAAQLTAEAEAAAHSRVVGGVHWPMDGAAGLAQGRAVAALVLQYAGISSAPRNP
jgi:membrane-associated phospholipid phosphatase